MLPARYVVQKEVEVRRGIQRCEAERWRLAKMAHGGEELAAGGLPDAVVQAIGVITVLGADLLALLSRVSATPPAAPPHPDPRH